MTDNTQPEAVRLAVHLERFRSFPDDLLAAAELRRLAELEAQLGSAGFTAADMATAEARGFRDGVASVAASAGSEPVAHLWQHGETGRTRVLMPDAIVDADASWRLVGPLFLGSPPSPPEGAGWISVDERLPEPGMPVLLDIGKKYPIRAMWAAKHTVEAADDDTDGGEYDEATDTYYCPEGWYEWNQCEDNHWRVTETPLAWAPLPLPAPPASEAKGA